MQKIESELAPKLAAHRDAIHLNGKLFARVEELFNNRDKLDWIRNRIICWNAITRISSAPAPSFPIRTSKSSKR